MAHMGYFMAHYITSSHKDRSVLQAYRLACARMSTDELLKTLIVLNYTYPYHQSIGFYMDLVGGYEAQEVQKLGKFKPIEHDFYLDYKMTKPMYSEKWRVYYPRDLV